MLLPWLSLSLSLSLSLYLAQHVAVSADGTDIAVDVTKVVMAGEQSVRKNSQMDTAEKASHSEKSFYGDFIW